MIVLAQGNHDLYEEVIIPYFVLEKETNPPSYWLLLDLSNLTFNYIDLDVKLVDTYPFLNKTEIEAEIRKCKIKKLWVN